MYSVNMCDSAHGYRFATQPSGRYDVDPAAYTAAAEREEMPQGMPRDPWFVHFAYPASCGAKTPVRCLSSAANVRVYPYTADAAPPVHAVRGHVFTPVAASEMASPPTTYAARVAAELHVRPMGH
jgi:hypothetical protein